MSIRISAVISIAILLLFLPLVIFINGCSDTEVINNPPPTDTNVVIYRNLTPVFWQVGTYDTSSQTVNLYEGQVRKGISDDKDIVLIDSINTYANFYFRSGDLSKDSPGKETWFYYIYPNMESTQFDTLSVIPDSNGLDTLDFTYNTTRGTDIGNPPIWGSFNVGQTTHPVYSFYLKGKYAWGETRGFRVYGVIYIKKVESVMNTLGSYGVQITIDVKLNRIGANHFKP